MVKTSVIVAGVVGVAVVIGGIVYFTKDDKQASSSSSTNSITSQNKKDVAVNDPNGEYKLFSDPSITKKPEAGVEFGNGQVLSFDYDGSKSNNDSSAKITYDLFYIQDNGSVIPMGGAPLEGTGSGTFKTADSDRVFKSEANGRKGFMQLTVTSDTKFDGNKYTSDQVKLGTYAVTFTVAQ